MLVLRDLRVKQTADPLASASFSVAVVSEKVGYASRSSFVRVFRRAYVIDPSVHRSKQVTDPDSQTTAIDAIFGQDQLVSHLLRKDICFA
jgi:AraC family transcriptional activator of mtrCDE